jgi:hypothetical protein
MKRLALVLSALVACATPRAFVVDPAFPPPDSEQIANAADAWNARTQPGHRITVHGGKWRFLAQNPPNNLGFNGLTKLSERTIWCAPHPGGGSTVYAVALHEFGHALGLGHTTTGVMMPFTVSTEFTPEVIAECRRAGACK